MAEKKAGPWAQQHPSREICAAMMERNWSYSDLLHAMQIPTPEQRDTALLALLIYGTGNPELLLDYTMARWLGTAFGTPALHWLKMDHAYRAAQLDAVRGRIRYEALAAESERAL